MLLEQEETNSSGSKQTAEEETEDSSVKEVALKISEELMDCSVNAVGKGLLY